MRALCLLFAALIFTSIGIGACHAQEALTPPPVSWSITPRSVGAARTGLTVARLRKALPGMRLKHETGEDGVALIGVWQGNKELMKLFAGEDDPQKPIRANAKVVQIEALDHRFRTKRGIRPGMLLSKVEEKYGKLLKIDRSEIEGLEYAYFTKQEPGVLLKVASNIGTAGAYRNGKGSSAASTSRYRPEAKVIGIVIRSGKL